MCLESFTCRCQRKFMGFRNKTYSSMQPSKLEIAPVLSPGLFSPISLSVRVSSILFNLLNDFRDIFSSISWKIDKNNEQHLKYWEKESKCSELTHAYKQVSRLERYSLSCQEDCGTLQ